MNFSQKTILTFLLIYSASCQSDKKSSILPASIGREGEILVVCDSLLWKSSAGIALKNTLKDTIHYFSGCEPFFNITYIPMEKFSDFWKRHKIILFAGVLDGINATGKFINHRLPQKKIINGLDSLFYFREKDLFASGQQIHFLVEGNQDALAGKILQEGKFILENLLDTEIKNKMLIFKNKFPETFPKSNREFSLHLPTEFLLIKDTSGFVWWRYAENIRDRNIFISWKPYLSQKQFSDSALTEWHCETGKKFIYGNDSKNSFLTLQEELPLVSRWITYQGNTGKEIRGLWKTNNNTMGGPFMALVFTDKKFQTLFFVEAFLYAPNEPKRNLMRELEGLLWTVEEEK